MPWVLGGAVAAGTGLAFALNRKSTSQPTPANQAPTDITLSSTILSENKAGAVIGQLQTQDPNQQDRFTYQVNDARFEIVNGTLKLKEGIAIDYEQETNIPLTITSTDNQGLSIAKTITIKVLDVEEVLGNITPPPANTNNAHTDILLSNNTIEENIAGATIGQLTVIDPDADSTFTYKINDDRFEIVNGNLKLKEGIKLDYETAANVIIQVTASDQFGASFEKGFDLSIIGNSVLRTTLSKQNIIKTGNGNDTVIIVGKTSENQFVESDIKNVLGRGVDLSEKLTLNEINNHKKSEIKKSDVINLGKGFDKLIIYGDADLSDVELSNVSQIWVMGMLKIPAKLLDSLPLTSLIGDGTSILYITNLDKEEVRIDFDSLSLSGFNAINIDKETNVIINNRNLTEVKYIGGKGSIQSSVDSEILDLSGKTISVEVKNYDGNTLEPLEHKANIVVDGMLFIGSNLDNQINGTDGNDRLIGKDGNDHIIGGDGDDIIFSGKGNDILEGGSGNDKFIILGDVSGGGKLDNDVDNFILGRSLSSLNGINFSENKNSSKIINGGEGEDTLYVIGESDLSNLSLDNIENIEIRSDITLNTKILYKIKNIQGDGTSILRLTGDSTENSVIYFSKYNVSGIQQLDISENITVVINNIEELDNITTLTGRGHLIIKDTNNYLNELFTVEKSLNVIHENGSLAIGNAKIIDNHIEKDIKEDSIGGYKIFKGTDNSDRISASEVNDRIETKKGDDTLIGKSGDDIYFINGSGHKSIIDIEGNDTLDFSELNAYNGVQVDLNNHIAEAKTEDGNSLTVKMLTGEDVSKNKQPLDLVIMQDLSGSFNDDVITVRQLLDNLTKEIIEKNPNTWFGAASFVDKPREPFGNSEDYVYKTHSKLSHDINSLKQAFLNMIVKSGGDGAEAQLEALYQLALRTIKDDSTLLTNDGEIDFRPNSQRFVVITTDAPYHKSGDFDGVPPNNGDIVLDGTPNGTFEDFPSIEAVKQALIKSNIIPIFAVTHSNIKTYQNLVDSLGRGSVVKLSSDSADLIDAVGIGLNTYKTDFIENIIGTKFDDKIIGNNLDNELNGNNGNDILIGLGGNDHLIGGNGQDTAKYQGNKEDYEISVLSSNKLLIKGTSNNALDDAIDIVDESVEYLEFASGEIVNTIDYFKNVNKKGYKELFSDWKGGYLDFMFNLASAVYIRKNIHKYYNVGGDNDEFTGNSYSQLLEYKDNLLALDLNLGSSISSYREGNERKGSLASFKYIYSNNPSLENDLGGDYISISNKDIVNPVSSSSIAQAYKTSKGDALFISFRGTSTKSDIIDDIWDMSGHYQRYKPFVDSIRNYIDSHPEIEKVFVAGHSLGGEMAKFFMNDFKGDDRFNAVIFEAANKYVVGKDLHYDERIIAIEMEGDPVPDLTLATLGKTIHIYEDEENPNMGIKFHNHKLITIKKPFEKVVNELYSNGFVNNLGEGESKLPSDIFFVPDEGNRNIVNSNNITGSELSNYRILNGLGAVIGTIGTAISAGKFIIELSIIGSHSYISHKLEKIGFIYSGGKYRFTLSERADDLASTFSELFEGVSSALSASNIGLPPLLDLMKLGYNAHPIFEDSSYGKAMVYTPTSLLSNTISPINKDIDIVILKEDGWIRDKILNTSFTINGKFLNNRESDGKLYLVGNNTNNILIANDEGSILISGGDRDILIGGNGNDVMFSGNIVDYPGYNQENPIHRLIEKYMINKEADISFQYGGKGNDILIGNGDNDYFFIDVNKGIGSLEYSNNNNIDNIYNFQVDTVGTVFSEDYLIFSAEQLGFDYNKFINKKIDDSDDKVNFVSENIGEVKFEGFHWFDQYEKGLIDVDAFIKVNRISDYEKLKGNAKANEPTFILDKSNGYLYFDLTGTAHPNDHTLVAKLSDTTESGRGDLNSWFNDMNASQIIIVPNFDMLTSYQII